MSAPEPPAGADGWLTLDEAGERLRVSRSTVNRMISRGELRAYHSRYGRMVRVKVADVDDVLTPILTVDQF